MPREQIQAAAAYGISIEILEFERISLTAPDGYTVTVDTVDEALAQIQFIADIG